MYHITFYLIFVYLLVTALAVSLDRKSVHKTDFLPISISFIVIWLISGTNDT